MMMIVFLALMLMGSIANATTRYASPGGSGGSNCTAGQSRNTPLSSLNNGIACLGSGDTLVLLNGTYNENPNAGSIPSGGSSSNPTIIKAENNKQAIISVGSGFDIFIIGLGSFQSNITFDGIVVDGNFQRRGYAFRYYSNCSNIVVQNSEIRNILSNNNANNSGGIAFGSNSGGFVVRGNTIHDIGGETDGSLCSSCYSYGLYLSTQGALVENNDFYNISGYAVHGYSTAVSVSNNIVRNNFFKDTGPAILIAHTSGSQNQIYNNIMLRPGTSVYPYERMGIRVSGGQNFVWNNTVVGSGGECAWLQGNGIVAQNNICYQTSGGFTDSADDTLASNTVGVNPVFANPSPSTRTDFQLTASTPTSIRGAGICLGNVPTDIGGNVRSAPCDVGAWEFGGAPATPQTYHTAKTGNDGNSCTAATNPATPKLTIGAGAACVTVAGSKLEIHAGTYDEIVDTAVTSIAGGSDLTTNATVIEAYQSDVVTWRMPVGSGSGLANILLQNASSDHHIIFKNIIFDANSITNSNGVYLSPSAHHIRFDGCTFKNATNVAVFEDSSNSDEVINSTFTNNSAAGVKARRTVDGMVVQGSTFSSNTGRSVWLTADGQSITNVTIIKNDMKNSGGAESACAIEVSGPGATSGLIANNKITGNYCGLVFRSGTSGFTTYNNTVAQQSAKGAQIDSGVTSVTFVSNIFDSNAGGDISDAGTSTVFGGNFCATVGTGCANTGALSYVNSAGGNYDLPTGSPAIDKGICVLQVTDDILGRSRPFNATCDPGAYESRNSPAQPPVTPAVSQLKPWPFHSAGFTGFR